MNGEDLDMNKVWVLATILAAAGLTGRQIEKVCYANMARVFADVLPG